MKFLKNYKESLTSDTQWKPYRDFDADDKFKNIDAEGFNEKEIQLLNDFLQKYNLAIGRSPSKDRIVIWSYSNGLFVSKLATIEKFSDEWYRVTTPENYYTEMSYVCDGFKGLLNSINFLFNTNKKISESNKTITKKNYK